jgi:hypothetical protein
VLAVLIILLLGIAWQFAFPSVVEPPEGAAATGRLD